VTLFTLAEDERMVSVTRLAEVGNGDEESEDDGVADADAEEGAES
jgi:hypothetical protein